MANLLTTSEIRDHVETDLVDGALDRITDAADAEIIRRLGPLATHTQVVSGNGGRYLFLTRKSSAIVSADERVFSSDDIVDGSPTDYSLETDDYSLLSDGYRVERLSSGTNASEYW